jgi:hypothetical protein
VNIAAVNAALKLDLDSRAKLAVVVLATRAHRGESSVWMTRADLARAMNLDPTNAYRALRRAVDCGALVVDDRDYRGTLWRLEYCATAPLPSAPPHPGVAPPHPGVAPPHPRTISSIKDLEKDDAGDDVDAQRPSPPASVNKPAVACRAGIPPDVAEASRRALKRAH